MQAKNPGMSATVYVIEVILFLSPILVSIKDGPFARTTSIPLGRARQHYL
jgi:hypothetical protein